MRIRSIDCPGGIQLHGPVMQPEDIGAAAQASQLLQQASQQAEQVVARAYASAEHIQQQTRDDFLSSYAGQFHAMLNEFVQSRIQMEGRLDHYAREVMKAALQRLGLVLPEGEKLRLVLEQVIAETLPDVPVRLQVAAGRSEQVQQCLEAGKYPLSRFSIEVDPALADDDIVVVGPQGSRISCSFNQIVNQLLLCV